MNENNKLVKKRFFGVRPLDVIFIVAALAIASIFFIKAPSATEKDSKKLLIFSGDTEIELPFVDQTINFKNDFYDAKFNKYNLNKDIILEVKDKKARVTTSDCPDKVCINSGWATNCGHMIICMPNSFGALIDCKGSVDENK